jgi:hypothetical protein
MITTKNNTTELRGLLASLLCGRSCPSQKLIEDLDGREIVVTPFNGAYGQAGTIIALNGSPPRGVIVCCETQQPAADTSFHNNFYIGDGRSRRLGSTQAAIVRKFLAWPQFFTCAELAAYKEPQVVSINVDEYLFQEGYSIPFDRCTDASEVVEWVAHMSEKVWFTTRHVRQFIALVEKQNPGIRAYGC